MEGGDSTFSLPPLAPFPSLFGRIFWYKELAIGAFQLWAKSVSRDASRQPAARALPVEQKHYIVSACAPIDPRRWWAHLMEASLGFNGSDGISMRVDCISPDIFARSPPKAAV